MRPGSAKNCLIRTAIGESMFLIKLALAAAVISYVFAGARHLTNDLHHIAQAQTVRAHALDCIIDVRCR